MKHEFKEYTLKCGSKFRLIDEWNGNYIFEEDGKLYPCATASVAKSGFVNFLPWKKVTPFVYQQAISKEGLIEYFIPT